ncbi:MAG: hypothetical protein NTX37_06420 [Burkholderiales bacterium]|nr:hypothetical protein [Burkholderiales bacterium]
MTGLKKGGIPDPFGRDHVPGLTPCQFDSAPVPVPFGGRHKRDRLSEMLGEAGLLARRGAAAGDQPDEWPAAAQEAR